MVPTSPWRTSCTVPSPGTCSRQQLLYYSPALSHPRGEGRMHPKESKNAIWSKWTQPSNERKQLGFLALPLFCFHLWSNWFYSLSLYFTSKKLSPGWSPQLYGTEPWAPISARITHSNTNNGNRNVSDDSFKCGISYNKITTKKSYQNNHLPPPQKKTNPTNKQKRQEDWNPKKAKHRSWKEVSLLTPSITDSSRIVLCWTWSNGFDGVAVGKKYSAEVAGTDLKVTRLIHFRKQLNTEILWAILCLLLLHHTPWLLRYSFFTVITIFFSVEDYETSDIRGKNAE